MIKYACATVGAMRVNCYAVYCDGTKEGIIIDPGANFDKIKKMVEDIGMKTVAIVLTHAHFDHITHADELKAFYNVPLMIHEQEAEILADSSMNLSLAFTRQPISTKADVLLKENDTISFGNCKLKVIHTPGHTKGSMCLLGENVIFSGDTLFKDSYGRTDFPTGDAKTLANSISRLFELDDNIAVNPGHNESTTIGREKKYSFAVKYLMESVL